MKRSPRSMKARMSPAHGARVALNRSSAGEGALSVPMPMGPLPTLGSVRAGALKLASKHTDDPDALPPAGSAEDATESRARACPGRLAMPSPPTSPRPQTSPKSKKGVTPPKLHSRAQPHLGAQHPVPKGTLRRKGREGPSPQPLKRVHLPAQCRPAASGYARPVRYYEVQQRYLERLGDATWGDSPPLFVSRPDLPQEHAQPSAEKGDAPPSPTPQSTTCSEPTGAATHTRLPEGALAERRASAALVSSRDVDLDATALLQGSTGDVSPSMVAQSTDFSKPEEITNANLPEYASLSPRTSVILPLSKDGDFVFKPSPRPSTGSTPDLQTSESGEEAAYSLAVASDDDCPDATDATQAVPAEDDVDGCQSTEGSACTTILKAPASGDDPSSPQKGDEEVGHEVAAPLRRRWSTSAIVSAAAAGGAAICGTSGAVAGTAVGSVAGAAVGVIPAVFTLGLSIPVGAAVGGATGFCTGAAGGGTVGLVAGGAAGYGGVRLYDKRTPVSPLI